MHPMDETPILYAMAAFKYEANKLDYICLSLTYMNRLYVRINQRRLVLIFPRSTNIYMLMHVC